MNNKVFVSCAVTGSGDTAGKHPDLPKTPEQIAKAAIEAAKAGAAIAHIHVRENDGKPSRRLELYKEVVDRVRSSGTDVILNLTTGMGGDLDIGQGKNPLEFGPLTDMANVMERIANAEQLLPEICTLDCGTLNFGDSSVITVNTPNDLRKAAKKLKEIGVKPEIEAFDLGNMWFGSQLYKEGLLSDPPMFQLCLGIPWGAPATPLAMQAMIDIMPKEAIWSGFAISKNEMPYVAQTVVMGGNPRVGLEDNLYLSKGKLATNAQLVEKAIRIINDLGASTMTPAETGKKILFVNWTYTKKIIDLNQKESDETLTKIFEHQAKLELTCRFTWTENTVCIWDNRSVIHFAIADFYPGRGLGYERIMDRIAIEGDHPN